MKVSENFIIQEFVDKYTYDKFGDKSLWFINPNLFTILEVIREHFGQPITINNWHTNGFPRREWSGLRTPSSPYYSVYSSHSRGDAIDFLVKGVTADEVRNYILRNEDYFLSLGLTELEMGVTWVHAGCKNTLNKNSIYQFNA